MSPQSPDIGKNSDGRFLTSRFLVNPLLKKIVINPESDDVDMKLALLTKLDKRNKTSKKFHNEVMLENCDIIVIFLINGQIGVILKPDS